METDPRLYPYEDAELMAKAKVYRSITEDNLTEFEGYDPDLNTDFLNEWEATIEAAYDIPTDETTMDIMEQFTKKVDQHHEDCMVAMRDLRYYAAKAFKKNSSEWAYLNFNGLKKARPSASRTVVYMLSVHRVASELSALLQAKGMLAAQIDALSLTAQALLVADTDQEHHKHYRLMLTRKRVETLNHLWSFSQQVNKASKSVFRDDYAKYHMFELS
jgi:hypothetical protein